MEKNISTLLMEIKTQHGWTQTRLAVELGTTQATVNRILNGQDDCRIATFKAICALHATCRRPVADFTPI
jgi:transcriptional regulator with XRE-family HTH domain